MAPQTPLEAINRHSPAVQFKKFYRTCSAMGVFLMAGFVGLSTSDRILTSFVTAHVCYAHPSSCHAGVCHVAEGFCVTAAGLPAASRFPARRMRMDEVAFHREPPLNIPTLVTAFDGWIDAGEAATDAMRFLVHQLAAEPLAEIDPEDFIDFTQVRPIVRLTAAGERTIRWPRVRSGSGNPRAARGCCCFGG